MTSRAYLFGDIPVLGPIGVGVTGISNTAVSAIGADFLRHGIFFHNPNASTVLRIAPIGVNLVAGSGGIAIEPFSDFVIFDSTGGELGNSDSRVRVNCGWNVVADSAGSFGLTIWNFTDANPAVSANPPEPVASLNLDIDITSPNGGQVTNLTTASATLLGANQNRRGILFHNPGAQNKAVAPANLAASQGAGSIIILPKAQKEIRAFGKVRVNCGFNAQTANNGDGSLSWLEFV